MDHPEEEISEHINMPPNMLFDPQPILLRHYQSSPFKRTQETRSNSYTQQKLICCCSCRIVLVKTPYISFEKDMCCIACFSNIFIFPSNYQICNAIGSSIFDQRWAIEEELSLLTALQKLGYGNWGEIQAELCHKKKALEIENHYQQFYANYTEPPFVSSILNKQRRQFKKLIVPHNSEQQQQQLNQTEKRNPMMNSNIQKNTPKPRKLQNEPFSYQKLIGYQQKRDEFQIQFDNQLELLIAEMEFAQTDTQDTRQLKMNMLQLFSHRLQKRYQIKDFIMSRRLLDLSELSQNQKKKKKEERQLTALLKPFARFSSQDEMEMLILGLLKQNSLRKQILRLKDNDNFKTEHPPRQKQNSRASSTSTGFFEKNMKEHLKKSKNAQQKDQCWFLGKKDIQICNKHGIDFIPFTFIKETVKSINAIQGKINPEEYFYSIFRLNKEAIHQICQHIQEKLQTDKKIEPVNP